MRLAPFACRELFEEDSIAVLHIQPLLFGFEVVFQNRQQQDTHQIGGEAAVKIWYSGDHIIVENGSKEAIAPAVFVGNGSQSVGKAQAKEGKKQLQECVFGKVVELLHVIHPGDILYHLFNHDFGKKSSKKRRKQN